MVDRVMNGQSLRRRVHRALVSAETFFNHVADSERQWWPFEFLKPSVEERFSTRRAAMLAVLQGLPIGVLLMLVDTVSRHAALGKLVTFLSIVCVTVFATNRLT